MTEQMEAERLYNSEAKELLLRFVSYNKFLFQFEGETSSIHVVTLLGGSADEIYRLEIDTNPFPAPPTFSELINTYVVVNIRDKKTDKCYTFYRGEGK